MRTYSGSWQLFPCHAHYLVVTSCRSARGAGKRLNLHSGKDFAGIIGFFQRVRVMATSKMHRGAAFARLVEEAQACQVCPRMVGRTRLLSSANGSLEARVCFMAEAPG